MSARTAKTNACAGSPNATNHRRVGTVAPSWRALTHRHTRAVIYMPDPDYGSVAGEAIRSGLRNDALCIIVSSLGRPDQQMFSTRLRHLASVATLPAPAVIIIKDIAEAPEDGLVWQFCQQILGNAIRKIDSMSEVQSPGDTL